MTILSQVECTSFTQSNIGKSGRTGAIFVVGHNLAKTCTQSIIENLKDQRPNLAEAVFVVGQTITEYFQKMYSVIF